MPDLAARDQGCFRTVNSIECPVHDRVPPFIQKTEPGLSQGDVDERMRVRIAKPSDPPVLLPPVPLSPGRPQRLQVVHQTLKKLTSKRMRILLM